MNAQTVLIVGASRGVGLETTRQALETGHRVRALARSASSMELAHKNLTKIDGSSLNQDIVDKAVEGTDVVITTIGMNPSFEPTYLFSDTAKCVIAAMKKSTTRRLIALTGIGAGDSKQAEGPLFSRIMKPIFLKQVYADKDREEQIIRESDLDWVIVRPGFLTRFSLTKRYKVLTDIEDIKDGFISRADVAHFLVRLIDDKSFDHMTPAIIS